MKKAALLLLFFTGIVNGQILNIPDANFKAYLLSSDAANGIARNTLNQSIAIDSNADGEIQNTEAALVNTLFITSPVLTTVFGIQYFPNLRGFVLNGQNIAAPLDIATMSQLEAISIENTGLTSLDLTGLSSINNVQLTGNNALTTLITTGAEDTLVNLICNDNKIQSLDVSNFTLLTQLLCNNNELTSLNVQGCTALTNIDCYQNNLTSIDFSGLTNLVTTQIMTSAAFDQSLTSVNLSGCAALVNPQIYTSANMTTLNFSGCAALTQISNSFSTIQSIDLNGCAALTNLNIGSSSFTNIDLSSCTALQALSLQFHALTSVDLSGYTSLTSLDVSHGNLTSINVNGCAALLDINVAFNTSLPTLDVSTCTSLNDLIIGADNLTSLFIKNGRNESIVFSGNANLAYVCADESQFEAIRLQFLDALPNAVMNSYCSFVPGGNYNTITGKTPYDVLGDGCDASDISNPYIKVRINDGTNSESSFSNPNGNYTFYTQTGSFTLTPEFENPAYFNIAPVNPVINFPLLNNTTQIQDFCITANGVHPDLEIILVPIDRARPGFDTKYKIIYRNKGNQIHSGSIDFTFDDSRSDLISATPNTSSQSVDHLFWNFSNLLPLETREINFVLNLNTPLETPPLVQGDILYFDAVINTIQTDETPADNTFNCHQTVVNAHDPNDKVCLEGNTITIGQVGKYVHYNINFENIGTADAINIVVKDSIDATKLDIGSLQLLYASHAVETKIRGNAVEFIFNNIHLPPSDIHPIGGHGNVLFKIKTVETLVVGDEITNTADIFFDYNAPIQTNEAKTTIASLGNGNFIKDESISIAPNPAKNSITISAENNLQSVLLFDAQGRLLQTVLEQKNTTILDISKYTKGIYFVKINTEKGSAVQKIIKE